MGCGPMSGNFGRCPMRIYFGSRENICLDFLGVIDDFKSMNDYKKLLDTGRLACVQSIDLLNEIIKVKKFLGQDASEEKAKLVLMLDRFEKINNAYLRIEALMN